MSSRDGLQIFHVATAEVILLIYLCLYLNAHFLVENPLQSLVSGCSKSTCYCRSACHDMCVCACAMHAQIVQHLRFAELIRWKPIFRAAMKMGAYGHPTLKPTMLVSDDPWVFRLDRTGVCVSARVHMACVAHAQDPRKRISEEICTCPQGDIKNWPAHFHRRQEELEGGSALRRSFLD